MLTLIPPGPKALISPGPGLLKMALHALPWWLFDMCFLSNKRNSFSIKFSEHCFTRQQNVESKCIIVIVFDVDDYWPAFDNKYQVL